MWLQLVRLVAQGGRIVCLFSMYRKHSSQREPAPTNPWFRPWLSQFELRGDSKSRGEPGNLQLQRGTVGQDDVGRNECRYSRAVLHARGHRWSCVCSFVRLTDCKHGSIESEWGLQRKLCPVEDIANMIGHSTAAAL